ncbi:MAG: NIPSNAP family protein [Gaiellaceae bacterium]
MTASSTNEVAVVELRQYTLVPGRRDEMISIFERHLIEPQEDVGMRVIGHFRDQVDPDRFVWLRGFRDMPSRRAALEAFYNGALWREHRDAVNATIVDSDDVLLLRPAPGSSFGNGAQAAGGGGPIVATIWLFAQPVPAETMRVFTQVVAPRPAGAGATPIALLVTEPSENDFPRLPVREGENVVVSLARFHDAAAYEAGAAELVSALGKRLAGPPQPLRLEPAERSRLA